MNINKHEPVINIRYITDYPKCNYSCVYCIAGHGEVTKGRERHWSATRYAQIIDNMMHIPHKINVRLGVAGEFFLDKQLVDGAARLSHSNNVASVNLITNLSFRYHHYQKILEPYNQDKIAIVASFHPSEIEDHAQWADVAQRISQDYDFSIVMVAFPPFLNDLERHYSTLKEKGLEVFIQPFIGFWEQKLYPQSYTDEEEALIKSMMYSRHDYEFLMKLKKPGLCNAGHTSLFVNPHGVVYPCGMGGYEQAIGDLSSSPDIKLKTRAMPCPFSQCQCDTENINTVQFSQYYKLDALNQHKYHYRFAQEAQQDPRLSEWEISY